MGILKIARPINKAKNEFVKKLKLMNADDIDVFEGINELNVMWDYYRSVTAFVGDNFYVAYFKMWNGRVQIDFHNDQFDRKNMSIETFLLFLEAELN